jgi:hypothetical protein
VKLLPPIPPVLPPSTEKAAGGQQPIMRVGVPCVSMMAIKRATLAELTTAIEI